MRSSFLPAENQYRSTMIAVHCQQRGGTLLMENHCYTQTMVEVRCQVGGWQHALRSSLFLTMALCQHNKNCGFSQKAKIFLSIAATRADYSNFKRLTSHTRNMYRFIKNMYVFFLIAWDVLRIETFYSWEILYSGSFVIRTF
jgi:hypothetical protein